MTIDVKLKELGIALPEFTPAVANYLPFRVHGNLVIISGQLPMEEGKIIYKGRLGESVTLEEGVKAAHLCGINVLAQLKAAVGGDWSKVDQCLRVGGFVSSAPFFYDHPKVINGASDLMVAVLGDKGRHSRAAIGVAALPLHACVEVEAMFSLVS